MMSNPAGSTHSPQSHSELSDAELMDRVGQQDQEALVVLYGLYGTQVYSLTLRVLRDAHLAEEATQDTFLKIWHKGANWDPQKGQLSSWLLTIARYTAIDRLRREQRKSAGIDTYLDATPIEFPSHLTVGDARWMDGQLLRRLLAEIPEEQAMAIELAFYQGLTHSELADYLGWPLGTVKTRLRLGLQKLRDLWLDATGNPHS